LKHVKKAPKETDPNEPDKGSAEPLSRNLGSLGSIGKYWEHAVQWEIDLCEWKSEAGLSLTIVGRSVENKPVAILSARFFYRQPKKRNAFTFIIATQESLLRFIFR
jgi:hypothetical protein